MLPRRVVVIGSTGYLGSRLIPQLIKRGHAVTAVVRPESRARELTGCRIVRADPLDAASLAPHVHAGETIVQLVGVPKPAPWKGPQFRAVDLAAGLVSIDVARAAQVDHFVYVSVARPAPIMKDYLAVRRECEERLEAAGLRATILRPWYILGPGHWWPLALQPVYRLMEQFPATHDAAVRLGLVTLREMLAGLVWAVEHPPASRRVIEVPEIRRLGGLS
jgi:uncharacterized protein YbjT (DUF2867 family)